MLDLRMRIVRRYEELLDVAERLHPDALFKVGGVVEPKVALTIDDGPSSPDRRDPRCAQALRCRATFFVHTDRFEHGTGGGGSWNGMIAEGRETANRMPDLHRFSLSLSRTGSLAVQIWNERTAALSDTGKPRGSSGPPVAFITRNACCRVCSGSITFTGSSSPSCLPWDTHLPFPWHFCGPSGGWRVPRGDLRVARR